jgi:tRNA modification GTPase
VAPNPRQAEAIAAIATPPGRGGIGVVRVSGIGLGALADALCGGLPPARQAALRRFRAADGGTIDQGLALFFPAPHSYTGEDVLELQGHGGPVVMQMLLQRCLELGARAAEPGEFTRRAFLNDKLDLAQAEAVADLIEAATATAARTALRSLAGQFSERIHRLADGLIELRALIESVLDFPEEEVGALDAWDVPGRLERLNEDLAQVRRQARQGSLLRNGLHVVLVGQPNVGKSSLLNRLAGEERAIVTEIPGTTRDALREAIQIHGIPLHVVDTAGLRETDDEVERLGIDRTWREIERSDLVLLLVDVREGVTEADRQILGRLPPSLPTLTVFNKCDLLAAEALRPRGDDLLVSARTGAGMERLERALLRLAGWQETLGEDLFMARERHLQALAEAAARIASAGSLLDRPELLAEELRVAQLALNRITGEFTADDLLGEIFGRFCIGK